MCSICLQKVNNLTSSLYAFGTNLSRSASSVGERQSNAYVSPILPKRAETFGGFDNAASCKGSYRGSFIFFFLSQKMFRQKCVFWLELLRRICRWLRAKIVATISEKVFERFARQQITFAIATVESCRYTRAWQPEIGKTYSKAFRRRYFQFLIFCSITYISLNL